MPSSSLQSFQIFLYFLISLLQILVICQQTQAKAGVDTIYSKPIKIPINREITKSEKDEVQQSQSDVNIQFYTQNPLDGTYHFGYDIGDVNGRSYREEKREASGRILGQYGFMDPHFKMHRFAYVADEQGYRSWAVMDDIQPQITTTSSTTTQSPFRLKYEDLQLIGPIPKTWESLFKGESEDDEINYTN